MRASLRAFWEIGSTFFLVGLAIFMVTKFLSTGPGQRSTPTTSSDWPEWRESGLLLGPENASVVVAVFFDFTCPYCRNLAPVLLSLHDEFPDDLAIEFHHFVLVGRELSKPAAVMTECAARQGRFREMYTFLSDQVDSVGAMSPLEIAEEAGLPNPGEFYRCQALSVEEFPRISAGRELGERIGVTGTPSVWVNGELFTERTLQGFLAKVARLGVR